MKSGNAGQISAQTRAQLPTPAPQAVNWAYLRRRSGSHEILDAERHQPQNVAQLQPAWEWRTGEKDIAETDSTLAARPGDFQATPIVINDTMYLSTPFNRVVALQGNTGRELWSHRSGRVQAGQPSNGTGFVHRGVACGAMAASDACS